MPGRRSRTSGDLQVTVDSSIHLSRDIWHQFNIDTEYGVLWTGIAENG